MFLISLLFALFGDKQKLNIQTYLKNNTLTLRVMPHSGREELVETEQGLKLFLKAPAEDNKANLELIKFFKKKLGLRVKIISGFKSREKLIIIN